MKNSTKFDYWNSELDKVRDVTVGPTMGEIGSKWDKYMPL